MEPTTQPQAPEWTCPEVLRLIREFGKRPALWDPDCDDYKNRSRKHAKWLELANIFNCSRLEVERKMKILNSQYRRERFKAIQMKKAGKFHVTTWYGYKEFSFMNKLLERYKNKSEQSNESNAMPNIKREIGEEVLEDEESENGEVTESPCFVDVSEVEKNKCETQNFKDEWSLFGELVAHVFRKLPDDRTRCIVRHKINTVLYEAELATYGNGIN
ncbi:uncharacterized protein LOC103312726 [Tribolium castaneum]|uniref:MADF domain-containing protein n=1 Tax=Tribolium castaneum TaxID=7070 RepID=D2A0K0_TRICA|nr:PREDICTED: uncharacterized protein LOC103312726 [Tribolium castaneum]EFA01674.1 hypothetical protein TcasGA2_TC007246 [Tribolium castaneum]|eukprot:XP_008192359.1 PREDICTED: uncharacterized protein LOC103312726 [Tribolium castaneum]